MRPGAKLPTVEGISPDLIAGWSAERNELSPAAAAVPGRPGRAIALASAVVLGALLAVVLIPDFASWTAHLGLFHHEG